MKTLVIVLAVMLYAFVAQGQSKKEAKAEQSVSQEKPQQEAEKVAAKKEADNKEAELDQNTRIQLQRVRHQLYSFGQKPGC